MTDYVSTRGRSPAVPFLTALVNGLAPDGGLYVPRRWPRLTLDELQGDARRPSLQAVAERVLAPFVAGDALAPALGSILADALDFPLPLTRAGGGGNGEAPASFDVLELFHGPTAAFKDVGARFLAACTTADPNASTTRRTVLVATSGDTGGAVAAAFHGRPGVDVVVLFPEHGVSPRQRHQLTCFGDNVRSFAVRGTFDDCQRLLKDAFAADWAPSIGLTTANSINIARLLPQVVYYAWAALAWRADHRVRDARSPTFVVPSGNVGNATAALWAKHIGCPIAGVVLATNANRTVPDLLDRGVWEPRPSRRTHANAMDVGDPSNMERLFALYPTVDDLRAVACAIAVDDAMIEATIRAGRTRYGRSWDPHTACAVHAIESLDRPDTIAVATAHPAKFDDVVEPLLGAPVAVPPALAALLERPAREEPLDADLGALARALDV